jgi:NAD-dependent SIR2 family protein deacetylase
LAAQARREGARLVIVNQGETSLDDLADAKLRGPIGEVLPRLVPASSMEPDGADPGKRSGIAD